MDEITKLHKYTRYHRNSSRSERDVDFFAWPTEMLDRIITKDESSNYEISMSNDKHPSATEPLEFAPKDVIVTSNCIYDIAQPGDLIQFDDEAPMLLIVRDGRLGYAGANCFESLAESASDIYDNYPTALVKLLRPTDFDYLCYAATIDGTMRLIEDEYSPSYFQDNH